MQLFLAVATSENYFILLRLLQTVPISRIAVVFDMQTLSNMITGLKIVFVI